MDLSGTWLAAEADDALRRAALEPGFDDTGWEQLPVPGHWRSTPAFAESDGPLLYRRRFRADPPADDERDWLVLDGLFYQGDVWLDGEYVGDTEGYFAPHELDVTDAARARDEHVLAVEVACPRPTDLTAKRSLTGVFQHWDCLDPDWNPGGLWRPVRVERTGPVRITRLRLLCREADEERALLALDVDLDAAAPDAVELRTTVSRHGSLAAEHHEERTLAAGTNKVRWTVRVDEPELWWPHTLGDQPRYDVGVEVVTGGAVSHRLERRTGLRRLSLRNWILSVNGERLFVKGSNQGPTRMALGEAAPEELAGDVALATAAGLDLLRVHGHVSRPELYEAADDAGLLLWQDLPLQWGYARSVRKQAIRQAARAVDVLGHHPSIAVWCGHNEPIALEAEPGTVHSARLATRFAMGQELPTWNRTVLDRSIKRALEKADTSRPVIAHSGVLPHLPQLDGTDTHVYFGWYHGETSGFPRLLATIPRLARFVSEFGAQAVPEHAAFCDPDRWPDLDWERLGRHHALQKDRFDRYVPPAEHATFEAWRHATQRYQAEVIKLHVETLRRLKYRPTGGFAQFCFADGHPGVTWSVLDHERAPKLGYHALAAACRPVIVVADWLPPVVRPGDPLALDVHVVSDLREPLDGCVVVARLAWPGGAHTWRLGGDVPADACVRAGTLQALVPHTEGPLELLLELRGPGGLAATNGYRAMISSSPRPDGRIRP